LNTKAGLLEKMGKTEEAIETKKQALANATIMEIHGYARRLLDEGKKEEAMKLFEENYKKYNGAYHKCWHDERICSFG
jgi:tetratricopeptide (TPR) repeat protein